MWSDLMFGLAIRQFLLLQSSISYDSIRWSHSSILRESYPLRASDTTEIPWTHTLQQAFKICKNPPPPQTPNKFIQRKAGNNVLCYNKHLGLADEPECACEECNRQKRVRPPLPSLLPYMASEQTKGHSLSFTLEHFVLGHRQFWTSHTEWQNTGKPGSPSTDMYEDTTVTCLFQGRHSIHLGCAAGIFTLFPLCHHQPEAHFQVRGAQEKTGH
jgi:hypothetical protein